jgi:RND family efflux transporter MFP subunit
VFLQQALWKRFRSARDPQTFLQAWLGLLCRFLDDRATGVVVLGEADVGPFSPVAFWPEEGADTGRLSLAAERAMAERQGVVVDPNADGADGSSVAYPFIFDEQLHGVVAVSLPGGKGQLSAVMRQLQWGAGWVELMLRRQQADQDAAQRERTLVAFDVLAAVVESQRFDDACQAAVTELAMRLDCDPVSIGFVEKHRTRVIAISHAAQFGEKMNLVQAIEHAMDEAVDQAAVIVYPHHEDWDYRVVRAHEELAVVHRAGGLLTLPLHARGRVFGAVTLERPLGETFNEAAVELGDAVASVIGPVLEEKKLNDRWIGRKLTDSVRQQVRRLFGPRYVGRKIATLVLLVLVAFFSLKTTDYRVTSPARLEGEVQRSIVAPFDGYLAAQYARAGETVAEGQLLAALDDKDLRLEHLRWDSLRRQHLVEYDRAMAEHRRAEASASRLQIEEAEAQLALLDEQLARSQIRAPFRAVVVSGDLSQSVGTTLARGQELFALAPLDAYRVVLEVDERDISDVGVGQTGALRITSMPEQPFDFIVEQVTPVAEQAEGRNFYRVTARLHASSPELRPGMQGVAKTDVDERLLIHAWTARFVDWLRLAIWQWLP